MATSSQLPSCPHQWASKGGSCGLAFSWLCVHAQAAGPAHLDSCRCGHSLCHPLLHIQVNSPVGKAAIVCERRLCHGVHGPVAGAVDHQAEDERQLQQGKSCQPQTPRPPGRAAGAAGLACRSNRERARVPAGQAQGRCPRRAGRSPTSRRRRRGRRSPGSPRRRQPAERARHGCQPCPGPGPPRRDLPEPSRPHSRRPPG